MAQELQQPEAEATLAAAYRDEHHCGFNEVVLVFIAKKPSATDVYGELCFQASDARPICIVDTANRLTANAARLRWESLLAPWLAKEQRGFLPGRSMLANVVDIETEAMRYALHFDSPALILFDFAASFPSISQEYIFEVLEHLGVPAPARRLVRSLYFEHYGTPTLEGHVCQPISLTAGLRQGCPLSPLLFVLAVDSLLRRMVKEPHP